MLYEISEIKENNKILRNIFARIIPVFSVILLISMILVWVFFANDQKSWIFYFSFVFIVIFYIWRLIRWFEYVILLILGFFSYKNYQKMDVKSIFSNKPTWKQENYIYKNFKKSQKNYDEIYHWVIVPTFHDPYEMLQDTFDSIYNSDYDRSKLIVTLAGEQADEEHFKEIQENFLRDYKDKFFFVNTTLHPKWIDWELPWKGSNVSFSAKTTYEEIAKFNIESENILVSVMDSESIVQDRYFNLLSLEYCLTEPNMRDKTIYQPMLFLFNRFFSSPFFSKVIALSTTFYILAASRKWIGARAQAVQAQSLASLLSTKFYSVETITEDWHQYYRTYCTFNGQFQVKPVYAHILLEPVIGKNIWESIKLQYNQIKRRAHGALDLPYICICLIKNKNLPKTRTFYEILWLMESSVLWSSLQFILFLWSVFFFFIGWQYFGILPSFAVLGFLVLFNLLIITVIFLPWKDLKNKRQRVYEFAKYVFLSFTIMWPILLIINGLPALHAQMLILIGKPMWKFNVTKKYR